MAGEAAEACFASGGGGGSGSAGDADEVCVSFARLYVAYTPRKSSCFPRRSTSSSLFPLRYLISRYTTFILCVAIPLFFGSENNATTWMIITAASDFTFIYHHQRTSVQLTSRVQRVSVRCLCEPCCRLRSRVRSFP